MSLTSARVSGFMKAPPPVAKTCGPLCRRRASTRASPLRKYASPLRAERSPEWSCRPPSRSQNRHRQKGIDKRPSKPAADRRFTYAHHADKDDRARSKRAQQGGGRMRRFGIILRCDIRHLDQTRLGEAAVRIGVPDRSALSTPIRPPSISAHPAAPAGCENRPRTMIVANPARRHRLAPPSKKSGRADCRPIMYLLIHLDSKRRVRRRHKGAAKTDRGRIGTRPRCQPDVSSAWLPSWPQSFSPACMRFRISSSRSRGR